MRIVIAGCGTWGSEMARRLSKLGHHITIIDPDEDKLSALFGTKGIDCLVVDSLDEEALVSADISHADAFIAVTQSDTMNALLSQIAVDSYRIATVICRVCDPELHSFYMGLGLNAICPSEQGAISIINTLA